MQRLVVLFLLLTGHTGAEPAPVWVGVLYRAAGQGLVQAARVGVPGGEVRVLSALKSDNTGVPAVDPAGGRIAFVRIPEEGQYQLLVTQVEGGAEKLLLEGTAPLVSPVWSPDGSRLVCSRYDPDSQTMRLMVLEPGSAARQELDCGPNLALAPAWSPDGRQVAFTALSVDKKLPQLAVIPSTGGELRLLAEEFRAEPAWSPDGQQLVYVGIGPDRAPALYLCAADGGGARLLPGGEGGASPRWVQDAILFNRPTDRGVMELRWVPPGGGESLPLTPEGADAILSDAQGLLLPYYRGLEESTSGR